MKKTKTIFTIGSATFDIFVKPADQAVMTLLKPESREQWLCLTYGGKVKIDEVIETFGGGATNTAVAFARMGFDAYPVVKIGTEYGEKVIENLKREWVHTDFVKKTPEDKTGFSTIINALDGDRTVLGYPGANRLFTAKDLPSQELEKADWIFLSHISGDSEGVTHALTQLLTKHPKIHLAWNPGHEQFVRGVKAYAKLLKHTDVLFVNKEEAALFTGTPYRLAGMKQDDSRCHFHTPKSFLPPYADDVTDILFEFFRYGVKNVVITDGRHGAQASDGSHLYFCPVVTQKRVDTLGAGDGFASGLLAALFEGHDLKTGLKYGTLNANSVVSHYGAQKGLLTASEMKKRLKTTSLCISSTPFPK